jgi:D-alanyl-lipoteichoic acid acyltransferase DltB (MBOAT superfamily)
VTFNTLTFLIFLALVFAGHWALRGSTARNLLLLGASYFFYGWWDPRFAVLMLAASLVDFAAGLALGATRRAGLRRAILAASCVCSLGLLGFFKYFGFFAENAQALAAAFGVRISPVTLHVVLPVGISFYTFQTLSYVIDVYRGRLEPTRRLIEYLAYVSFFPQLVAGPIERAGHLLPQFATERRFDRAEAVEGLRFALWGFFKKLALADNFGALADATYGGLASASGPALGLATLAFSLQIYCDFSAYSDIATGTARLFGIRLMRNFAHPYFSQSVAEFWRRWHISLSSWFADYVYVPLGGRRATLPRRAANVMATFALSGLWHGASWNFVVWGVLNGLAVLPETLGEARHKGRANATPGGEADWPRAATLLRVAATFAFTCVAWVLFRTRSLADAGLVFAGIIRGPWEWASLTAAFAGQGLLVALASALLAVEWLTRRHPHPLQLAGWPRPLRWTAYTLLAWTTLALAREGGGPFIYFQF